MDVNVLRCKFTAVQGKYYATICLVLNFCGGLHAQSLPPNEVIESAFAAKYPISGGTVFVRLQTLSEFAATRVDTLNLGNAGLVHRLANTSMKDGGQSVDKIYEYILSFGRVPEFEYSCNETRQIKSHERVLFKQRCIVSRFIDWVLRRERPPPIPSEAYKAYFDFAHRYAELQDRIRAETDANEIKKLLYERDLIRDRWDKEGHRKDIEMAMSELAQIRSRDPKVTWGKLAEKFRSNQLSHLGYSFPLTKFDPPSDWLSSSGWETIGQSNTPDTNFSFEYKLIRIVRPWIDERVFGNLEWEWALSAPLGTRLVISDGTGTSSRLSDSYAMSLLPQRIVLARAFKENGEPITNPNAIILGYLCLVVPKTPIVGRVSPMTPGI